MYYIYKYTNKLNEHSYIGQTNNINRRKREHSSTAFNPNAYSYNSLFHKKLRQYGEENFTFEILEKLYTDDVNVANEREQYWIKYYKSFRESGLGYNSDTGGGAKKNSRSLTIPQLREVKEKIKQGISYYDLEQEYNISPAFISSINHGTYFYDENEQYPLFKYYKTDKDYDELVDLLINTDLTLVEIAKRLNMGYSTVKKINAGKLRPELYPTHPIRPYKFPKAQKTKELLLNTDYNLEDIMAITGYSKLSVIRINTGETHHDNNLQYPLRSIL